MATLMELIVRARDEGVSRVMDNIGESGERAGEKIGRNMERAGLAMVGAGVAIEGLARSQQGLSEQTGQLALALGMEEDAVRDMAQELSNATFPLESVLGLMAQGRQQGIESAAALQDYAVFWDMVGDATGESAEQLAKNAVGLRSVGVAAGEEGEAIAALGFIHQETSASVGDFLRFLDRSGPELREYGADINDAAAILAVMERELGLSARTARQEFATAVSQANGDTAEMFRILGITSDQVETYKGRIQDSSSVIEDYAQVHAETRTPMQRFKAAMDDLIFAHGEQIGMVSRLVPALVAMGPVVAGLGRHIRTLATSGRSMSTMLQNMTRFALNPWTLAIGAAVAGLAVWMKNKAEARDRIEDFKGTLDEETGAWTENTRAMLLNKLEGEGLLEVVNKAGIDLETLMAAIEGDSEAMEELRRQFDLARDSGRLAGEEALYLGGFIEQQAEAADQAEEATKRLSDAERDLADQSDELGDKQIQAKEAGEDLTEAHRDTEAAAEDLEEAEADLEAQFLRGRDAALEAWQAEQDLARARAEALDPALAMFGAVDKLNTAQETLNRLEEEGKEDTEEYTEALFDAVDAAAELGLKQDDLRGSTGEVIGAIRENGREAGLTADQIQRMVDTVVKWNQLNPATKIFAAEIRVNGRVVGPGVRIETPGGGEIVGFRAGGIGHAAAGGIDGRIAEAGYDEAVTPLNEAGMMWLVGALRRWIGDPQQFGGGAGGEIGSGGRFVLVTEDGEPLLEFVKDRAGLRRVRQRRRAWRS